MYQLLESFEADWLLAGKSPVTIKMYVKYLMGLFANFHSDPSPSDVKKWIASTNSNSVRRKRAQAFRAFGKWAELNQLHMFEWWRTIPVAKDKIIPQLTVTEEMYQDALTRVKTPRDKALVEVLWSTGLRRSEIARLDVADINLTDGYLWVKTSKTSKPRIAPISQLARNALKEHLGTRSTGNVFGLTSSSIRIRLVRLGLPSAHAWRRGWAVHSLRIGVSEVSVRAVAGWRSGEMVRRYTQALSEELAVDEFQRSWG